jgi:hypothetical protein
MINVNQISLSNDGAFIAIFYDWLDETGYKYYY